MKKSVCKSDLIRLSQPPNLVFAALFTVILGAIPVLPAYIVLSSWISSTYNRPPDLIAALSAVAIFGIFPQGIIAFVLAVAANTCYGQGNNEKAWCYSTRAKWLIISGTLLTFSLLIFVFSYLVIYGLDDPSGLP